MHRVELLDPSFNVVRFFEVDPTIPLASLSAKVERAFKVQEDFKSHDALSAVCWQVRRPDGRILCQVKNMPQGAEV